MKIFTIKNETNSISLNAMVQDAESPVNAERFRDEAGLASLAAGWPAARLVGIWNSLPGATPVRKFKDRATAVTRIWKAVQSLGEAVPVDATLQPAVMPATVEPVATEPEAAPAATGTGPEPEAALPAPEAPQRPHVAPPAGRATTKATRPKKSHTLATKASGSRAGSKTEMILGLLKQPGGATLKAIMETTRWQAHSVRGFVSGTLGRKMGLTVLSNKDGNGERTYSIQA